MLKIISNMKTIFPLSGMKNWSRSIPIESLKMSDCVKLVTYLRQVADIPPNQEIWDRVKIKLLKTETRNRKVKFFIGFALALFAFLLTAIFYLIGLLCTLSGNTCSSTIPNNYYIVLIVSSLITLGLFFWKRSVGRNHYDTDFQTYYHPNLTFEQKKALTDEIWRLKNSQVSVYELDNYENLKKLSSISWKAENWFLILTNMESDRSGIWLDGQIPLGNLYIVKLKNNLVPTTTNFPWNKLQLPAFRVLVSDFGRLKSFIEKKKNIPLERNQPAWFEALEKLVTLYSDYVTYLKGEMTVSELKEFEKLFSAIFAEIAKDKTKRDSNADVHDIGHKGAKNFLRGRNTSLEEWIKIP